MIIVTYRKKLVGNLDATYAVELARARERVAVMAENENIENCQFFPLNTNNNV